MVEPTHDIRLWQQARTLDFAVDIEGFSNMNFDDTFSVPLTGEKALDEQRSFRGPRRAGGVVCYGVSWIDSCTAGCTGHTSGMFSLLC